LSTCNNVSLSRENNMSMASRGYYISLLCIRNAVV
jgi:hypothetical protein